MRWDDETALPIKRTISLIPRSFVVCSALAHWVVATVLKNTTLSIMTTRIFKEFGRPITWIIRTTVVRHTPVPVTTNNRYIDIEVSMTICYLFWPGSCHFLSDRHSSSMNIYIPFSCVSIHILIRETRTVLHCYCTVRYSSIWIFRHTVDKPSKQVTRWWPSWRWPWQYRSSLRPGLTRTGCGMWIFPFLSAIVAIIGASPSSSTSLPFPVLIVGVRSMSDEAPLTSVTFSRTSNRVCHAQCHFQ